MFKSDSLQRSTQETLKKGQIQTSSFKKKKNQRILLIQKKELKAKISLLRKNKNPSPRRGKTCVYFNLGRGWRLEAGVGGGVAGVALEAGVVNR